MLAWLVPACLSEAKGDSAAIAFGQFKSLAGDWEGTYEWTGARTAGGSLSATYYLTGNGSALVENLILLEYMTVGAALRRLAFVVKQLANLP